MGGMATEIKRSLSDGGAAGKKIVFTLQLTQFSDQLFTSEVKHAACAPWLT
jgi:hypothetical protein